MNIYLNRVIPLFLLLLWLTGAKAQPVKCRVCNSKTGVGVAYASIITKNGSRGCSADSLGFFYASLTDSVRVTAIGYAPQEMTISSLVRDVNGLRVAYLSEVSFGIDEFTIIGRKTGKHDSFDIMSYSRVSEKGVRYNRAGIQLAIKVENKLSRVGFVEWVSFKFHKGGGGTPEAILRLRIYRVNSQNTNLPGANLLLDNVVVKPQNGWVKIDLSRYNISFPTSGLFVGLEWLESNIVAPNGQRVAPGVCYAFDSSCATSIECYRQDGWKPDNFSKQFENGCMMLKMKVTVNR